MSVMETVEEHELRDTQYPNFRVLTGGKGPPDVPSIDWLKDLKKNTVFSCKDKNNNGMVVIFILVFKHVKTYVLADALGNGPRIAADQDFCKRFSLLEVIEEGGEHPEEKDDGNSDGTLRLGVVENDADVEGGQPQHDKN